MLLHLTNIFMARGRKPGRTVQVLHARLMSYIVRPSPQHNSPQVTPWVNRLRSIYPGGCIAGRNQRTNDTGQTELTALAYAAPRGGGCWLLWKSMHPTKEKRVEDRYAVRPGGIPPFFYATSLGKARNWCVWASHEPREPAFVSKPGA